MPESETVAFEPLTLAAAAAIDGAMTGGGVVPIVKDTDFPALQFYTGKYLDCGIAPNAGFAIEPEYYPDTPNRPDFPDARLRAGETFRKYLAFVIE